METVAAFLQDLPEISPASTKGEKEKLGVATANLIDASAEVGKSFLSTLLGLVGNQDLPDQGCPTLVDPFLSEIKNGKIRVTTLLDFLKDNMPLFTDSELSDDFIRSHLGIKGSADETVSINESALTSESVLGNAEIKDAESKDVEGIELFPESGPENSMVTSLESKTGVIKADNAINGPDAGEVKPESENIEKALYEALGIESPKTNKIIPMNKESNTSEVKSGSELQRSALVQRVFETVSPKSENVMQMEADPEKENAFDKSTSPSEAGVRKTSDDDVKSGTNIPEGLTIIKEVKPDSVTNEKILYYARTDAQPSKPIEGLDKEISLNSESSSTQSEEGTVKSGAGLQKMSAIFNGQDNDSAKLEKDTQNGGHETEKSKLSSEIDGKETLSRSESGPQKFMTPSKSCEADSSGVNRNPQITETVTDNLKISREEKSDLPKENPSDSEKGEKGNLINRLVKGDPAVTINLYSEQKYNNIKTAAAKTEAFAQYMAESKVDKLDTANGQDALFSSNNQSAEKSFESLLQAKETPTPQRPFQADVLSQLLEKAVMSLKNGQTSINIRLKPESLGHLRMQIMTNDNQVMIKIHTEIPLVKDIIESNVNQLRAELRNQGLEIEKFDVSVDHGSKQNQGTPESLPFRRMAGETDDAKTVDAPVTESNGTTQNGEEWESGNLINFFA